MRNTIVRFMLLALAMTATKYSPAASWPDQNVNMEKMTVAELEKAGDQARAVKDWNSAVDYFQAAIRKDRKNAVLFNKMGMAQLQKGDDSGARSSFEKATKINSKYAEAVNNVGAVDYRQKKYGSAVKYFKKAVALNETDSTFHINLGAAWFSQKKMERAIAEYTRAMELDPDAFRHESRIGISAQISSPEERAQYSYLLAKAYAKRGDIDGCLQCLKRAKEDGYRNLANVYKDEEFSRLRDNPKLQEVIPPPTTK
jgi:Flp pilus assembly protein TadD